jgi:Zn ribbon nucleic-acid-binding protein
MNMRESVVAEKEAAVPCPKCRCPETTPLAAEGKVQRRQCTSCAENFVSSSPEVEKLPRSRGQARKNAAVPSVPRAPGPFIPKETSKAFDVSIEALRAQRVALETEIRLIDAAIVQIEKMKGLGGAPQTPFPGGA